MLCRQSSTRSKYVYKGLDRDFHSTNRVLAPKSRFRAYVVAMLEAEVDRSSIVDNNALKEYGR